MTAPPKSLTAMLIQSGYASIKRLPVTVWRPALHSVALPWFPPCITAATALPKSGCVRITTTARLPCGHVLDLFVYPQNADGTYTISDEGQVQESCDPCKDGHPIHPVDWSALDDTAVVREEGVLLLSVPDEAHILGGVVRLLSRIMALLEATP